MSPEEIIGIYKGLRLPILGLAFLIITAYVFWPSRRKKMEQPALAMLSDQPGDTTSPGRAQPWMATGAQTEDSNE